MCSIEGCDRPTKSRGWCNAHYGRWLRWGDPAGKRAMERRSLEELFAARTEWQGDCLVWTGPLAFGYGNIKIGERNHKAHRVAWEREHGPIPKGAQVDHVCHNRACVNTKHLRLATPKQNSRNRSGAQSGRQYDLPRNVYPRTNGTFRVSVAGVGYGTFHTLADATEAAERARAARFGAYAGSA